MTVVENNTSGNIAHTTLTFKAKKGSSTGVLEMMILGLIAVTMFASGAWEMGFLAVVVLLLFVILQWGKDKPTLTLSDKLLEYRTGKVLFYFALYSALIIQGQ